MMSIYIFELNFLLPNLSPSSRCGDGDDQNTKAPDTDQLARGVRCTYVHRRAKGHKS